MSELRIPTDEGVRDLLRRLRAVAEKAGPHLDRSRLGAVERNLANIAEMLPVYSSFVTLMETMCETP